MVEISVENIWAGKVTGFDLSVISNQMYFFIYFIEGYRQTLRLTKKNTCEE